MNYPVFAALLLMLAAPVWGNQFCTTHPLLKGALGLEKLTGEWVSMPTSVEPYGEIESHFEISKNQKSQFIHTLTANPEIRCKLNSAKIDESQYLIQFKLPANVIQPGAGDEETEYYSYVHIHHEKNQLRISQLDGLKFAAHLKSEKVEHQIFKDALFGQRVHGDTERIAAELKKNIRKFTIDEEICCRSGQLGRLLPPLKTSTTTRSDGYESYAEYTWYDDAIAIVESDFNMNGDHCWSPGKVIAGQASVVYLKWGGHHPESTGGYTIVQMQFPKTVTKSQSFELSPPKDTRKILPEKSWLNRNMSELTTGEISVFTFASPIGESMASRHAGFKGRLKFLEIDNEHITIELTLKNLSEFGISDNKRVFKLARTPTENAR